jgi:O-antigen ligase
VAAAVTYHEKESKLRFLPPIWLPFVLWGAWALVSVTWSLEPDRTLKEWRNEVFYTAAALWVCYVGAQARDAARIFLPLLGIAGATACLIALHDFAVGWAQYNVGWHGGPGNHSSALLVLMPVAAMTAWWAVRRRQPRWIALASVALAALFLTSGYTTLSRALWLAFAVQFIVLASLLFAREGIRGRVLAYVLAGAAIAGSGAVVLSVQAHREAAGTALGFEHDVRLELWPQIGKRIAERPLTGYGFGRGMLRERLQGEFKALDEHLWHAHNLALEMLVQVGIPGLLLLLVVLGALARDASRMVRGNDIAAGCGIALLTIVAGMLARNMTDSLLIRQNALLFWGTAGVLMALGAKAWQARN